MRELGGRVIEYVFLLSNWKPEIKMTKDLMVFALCFGLREGRPVLSRLCGALA